jgi:hypothetical protein
VEELETQHGMDVEEPRKFPWGCLIGGCLTVVVLMVGSIAAVGLGTYWFYKQQIAQYTSDTARELPVLEKTEEEIKAIQARVETFQAQVEKGEAPDQLVLTADDINALLSKEEQLRGRVFVSIEDGQIQAEMSFPTDAIPGAKGRFFNGSVAVEASLEEGVLIVTLQSAEVNGQPVPESIMAGIRQENLAKDMYKDAELAEKLRKFESLEIEGDKIILTPKRPSVDTPPAETPPADAPSADAPSADAPPADKSLAPGADEI